MSWFDSTTLNKKQKQFRDIATKDLVLGNDFGSYAKVVRTDNFSNTKINFHNDLSPKYRIALLKKYLPSGTIPNSIADMGCGLGLTSVEINRQYPTNEVCGYDVSQDAIDYARKSFNGIHFDRITIDDNRFFGTNFDLIFALEFHSFFQTKDLEFNRKILDNFMRHFNENDIIVIHHNRRVTENLNSNLKSLKSIYQDYLFKKHFAPIGIKILLYFSRNLAFSKITTWDASILQKTTRFALQL